MGRVLLGWIAFGLGFQPSAVDAQQRAPTAEPIVSAKEPDPVDLNDLFNEPYYGIYLTVRTRTSVLTGTALEPLVAQSFTFRPLIPIPLGSTALFVRPSVSASYAPVAAPLPGDDYALALSDAGLLAAWVPFPGQPVLWGLGPIFILPTATEDQFGDPRLRMGPAGGGFIFPEDWLLGLIAQQWWSIGGDDPLVSQFDLNYLILYSLPDAWQVGATPDIFIDWMAEDDNKVTFPVGLGAYKVVSIGSWPVQVGAEFHYSVIRPELIGEAWAVRLEVTPLWQLRERDPASE